MKYLRCIALKTQVRAKTGERYGRRDYMAVRQRIDFAAEGMTRPLNIR